jgi:hypothetical protein
MIILTEAFSRFPQSLQTNVAPFLPYPFPFFTQHVTYNSTLVYTDGVVNQNKETKQRLASLKRIEPSFIIIIIIIIIIIMALQSSFWALAAIQFLVFIHRWWDSFYRVSALRKAATYTQN